MPLAWDSDFFSKHQSARSVLELFEVLPDVIFYAKDTASRFTAANSLMLASKKLQSPEDLLGHTDLSFHPPALANTYMQEDQEVIRSGKPLPNQRWFVIDINGRPRWFRSSKVPLVNNGGSVIGIAGVRYAIETEADRENEFEEFAEVVRHMEINYMETITAATLAQIAGLSVTHFNRKFSQLFHTSPNRFLIAIRIERARFLLTATTDSIGEISAEIGFYDQSHFTRHFRQVTGVTPKVYRSQYGCG